MQQTSNQIQNQPSNIFSILTAFLATCGLVDAMFLTFKHYKKEIVPCVEGFECEKVLNSAYAEFAGVPIAVFGALAYFTVLSLAILTIYGYRQTWNLLTVLVTLMFLSSLWLVYLQAFVLEAFCQYCLISAGISTTLFIIAIITKFIKKV